jgi:hypothetical protein
MPEIAVSAFPKFARTASGRIAVDGAVGFVTHDAPMNAVEEMAHVIDRVVLDGTLHFNV